MRRKKAKKKSKGQKEKKMIQKKGAIELSMTTVVVIVLAMTMLILGIVLVQQIFKGATYNVDTINEKVRGEINKLFTEEAQRIVVYLPSEGAKVRQGQTYGVAFAVKNVEQEQKTFSYSVSVAEKGNCPANSDPLKWILTGKTGSFTLQSGDNRATIIKFQPALGTPLCTARFKVTVANYQDADFDVQILSK